MRLIDADYILSMLKIDTYAVEDQKYLKAMNRAKEIVKDAPSFRLELGWVQPIEALPEDFQDVVFVTKTGDKFLGVYYADDKEFWAKLAYSIDEVDGWIPVPKLPEE